MKHLTTNALLGIIALLLAALLLRPFIDAPVLAQSPVTATPPQPLMVTDRGAVYILQDGKLSAYILDSPTLDQLLPQAKSQKLKRMDTITIKPTP